MSSHLWQSDSDFFFFSSRRRHTRLTCDWSSDVCSSDLQARSYLRLVGVEQLVDAGEPGAALPGAQVAEVGAGLAADGQPSQGAGGTGAEVVDDGSLDRKSVV